MADQNRNNQTVTWNSGATAFDGYKLNVTDTASAAASLLQNFQVGGTVKFSVRKDGMVSAAGGYLPVANDGGALGASGTAFSDLFLASGGVINWAAGDVTITHSSNVLAFAGASSGYTFDDDGAFTGVVTASGGAVGAVGFGWAGDANTGIYQSADGEIAFASNGVNKGAFSANGFNVGLGTALINPAGATLGVSLSTAGRIVNYFTSGIGIQLGAGFASGTMLEFLRVGSQVGQITFTAGSVAYLTTSDYRIKENDEPLTDVGGIIDAMRPITYDLIGEPDAPRQYGFFAHELQAVFPNAAWGEKDAVDDEGNPILQGVDPSKLVVLLIAEVQSLRRRLAAAGL